MLDPVSIPSSTREIEVPIHPQQGTLGDKKVTVQDEERGIHVVMIIFGLIALAGLGLGIATLGAHQGWWVGATFAPQYKAIYLIVVSGIAAPLCLGTALYHITKKSTPEKPAEPPVRSVIQEDDPLHTPAAAITGVPSSIIVAPPPSDGLVKESNPLQTPAAAAAGPDSDDDGFEFFPRSGPSKK